GAREAVPDHERFAQSRGVADRAEIRAVTSLSIQRRDDDVVHAWIIELRRLEKALGVDQLIERNAERQGSFDHHLDRAADLQLHAEALLCEAAFETFARPIRDEYGCQHQQAAHQHDKSALQLSHCVGFSMVPPIAAAAARLRSMNCGMPRAISSPSTGRRSSGTGVTANA